jgi:Succinylglutamate desuccinylase / Aspartoacylase family
MTAPRPPCEPRRAPRRYSRRGALGLAGGALASALLAACGGRGAGGPVAARVAAGTATPVATPPPTATPAPTPTPRPVPPAGRVERTLMAGTDYATPAVLTHSGVEGPRVLVLGGVHGNEPGGWMAADAIAQWTVRVGSLVVVPRANIVATRVFQRTLPELGDLNRLYPGSADGLPMARMALEIVSLANEIDADLLIDMHESWGFYNERGANTGTAFIGQTVTEGAGDAALPPVARVVDAVNPQLTAREQLTLRSGVGRTASPAGVSTSSLSLGKWVAGLVPVLAEMGQQDQPVERRAQIHGLIVRTALDQRGML